MIFLEQSDNAMCRIDASESPGKARYKRNLLGSSTAAGWPSVVLYCLYTSNYILGFTFKGQPYEIFILF
jgi:hypothetical protein